jgi:hypothetical protein
VLESVKDSVNDRYQDVIYKNMLSMFGNKKYKQKILKLEEFIDDCYENETFNFKISMQTVKEFSNLIDDFFTFQYYLVNNKNFDFKY